MYINNLKLGKKPSTVYIRQLLHYKNNINPPNQWSIIPNYFPKKWCVALYIQIRPSVVYLFSRTRIAASIHGKGATRCKFPAKFSHHFEKCHCICQPPPHGQTLLHPSCLGKKDMNPFLPRQERYESYVI